MSRHSLILGLLLAGASVAAAWGLTLFNDPGELGRARALAMGLCLAGPVLGIVAGAAARDMQTANWVGAVNLLVLGLGFCGWMLAAWDGRSVGTDGRAGVRDAILRMNARIEARHPRA